MLFLRVLVKTELNQSGINCMQITIVIVPMQSIHCKLVSYTVEADNACVYDGSTCLIPVFANVGNQQVKRTVSSSYLVPFFYNHMQFLHWCAPKMHGIVKIS